MDDWLTPKRIKRSLNFEQTTKEDTTKKPKIILVGDSDSDLEEQLNVKGITIEWFTMFSLDAKNVGMVDSSEAEPEDEGITLCCNQ